MEDMHIYVENLITISKSMFHEGYALKKYVEGQGRGGLKNITAALGVSDNTVYNQYGNEEMPKHIVQKLKDAGIMIEGVTNGTRRDNISNMVAEAKPAYGLKDDYSVLVKELQMKDEMISDLRIARDMLNQNLQLAIKQLGPK